MGLKIKVQNLVPCKAREKRRIRRLAKRVLSGERPDQIGPLLIVLTGDEQIRTVNRRFLHQDKPTDVMAFVYGEKDLWGEIIISLDTCRKNAEEYGVPYPEELARLAIHGVLHVLGYEDRNSEERRLMTEKENRYLSGSPDGLNQKNGK